MEPTTKNPFSMLPENVRLTLYTLLGLFAIIFTCYQAADGDVAETISGVLAALGFVTAGSNVRPKPRRRAERGAADWGTILIAAAVAIIVVAVALVFFEGRGR